MFDVGSFTRKVKSNLPGESAQIKMAHAFRRKLWPAPSDAVKAAVLIILYPKSQKWHTALIKRSSNNTQDKHAGQISFPGGKLEAEDLDLKNCAIRETSEELGLMLDPSQIIAGLSPLYIPVSNFHVHPFVSCIDFTPIFQPCQEEVVQIIEVEIEKLADPKTKKHTDLLIHSGIQIKDVPYFDVDGNIVWGATAMIISELLEIMLDQ